MTDPGRQWRRCSACKQPIEFGSIYQVCSISTCNQKRTGMVFCTVTCWEIHLPVARHREAGAVEKTAPLTLDAPSAKPREPRRRMIASQPAQSTNSQSSGVPIEVLIVASRLKDYVRSKHGMNTSDGVLEPLSRIVRNACDQAVRNARRDGRKTLLDHDLPGP